MMSDRSSSNAYQILLETLRKHGLHWVAGQVQEQVRSGKPVTKDVSPFLAVDRIVFADEGFFPTSARKGRRQRLAATEEYSADERLELIIKAIESAVIHTAAIEAELAEFFASQADGLTPARFEPEEFDESARLEVERPSADRQASIGRLQNALSRLRREVGDGDI